MTTATAANNSYAARQLAAAAARMLTPKEFIVEPRVYFCQHNGAKFHVDLGKSNILTLSFVNYKVVTDDRRAQEQLDLVADQPGTFIYTLPHNEAAQVLEREAQQELQASVLATAAAQAGANGQQFDPRVPIVPVQTQGTVSMQLHGMQTYNAPNTGMQSSIAPSQATESITGAPTTVEQQTSAPGNSGPADALARLAALKNVAVAEQKPTVDFGKVLQEEASKTSAA